MGKIEAKMCLQSLSETYHLGSCQGKLFSTPLALWLFKLEMILPESAIALALLSGKSDCSY